MNVRPILFSAPMIRAILAGTKTQTRRALKKQPPFLARVRHAWFNAPIYGFTDEDVPAANWWKIRCPYGQPGDRLWVRESGWLSASKSAFIPSADNAPPPGGFKSPDGVPYKSCPSIHMPRWASRITLEITGCRVERLQDISAQDAIAEGIEEFGSGFRDYSAEDDDHDWLDDPRDSFKSLWESINGPGSWSLNPWVWVVEFKRV